MFKNNNGFSLVQVMIASAIAGGLSLVVMNIISNSNKAQKTLEVNQELAEVFSRVSRYIANKDICSRVFQVAPGDEIDEFKIDDDTFTASGIVLEKGEEIGNTNVIVERMEILPDVLPITPDQGIYDVTFRLTMKRKEGNYIMAGTTKIKDFVFTAKLCEYSLPLPYDESFNLEDLNNDCEDPSNCTGTCESAYGEPDFPLPSGDPSVGVFTCWKCGATSAIATCDTDS
ncbi:MAG: hypothetical protein N4A33_03400 [Bacteriovoracaceae bacterium]|jgi:type II secretory pathway pseudopilin PulG|nr:hypothetical protein [Bacteriovoracaceae bacterium]